MTDEEIKTMLCELLEEIDHDIAKEYDHKTTESPEEALYDLTVLLDIVRTHLEKHEIELEYE